MSKLKIPKYSPPSFESLKSQIPTAESFTETVPTIDEFMDKMPSMESYETELASKIGFNSDKLDDLESIIHAPTIGEMIEKGGKKVGLNIDGKKIDETQQEIEDFKSSMQNAAFDKVKTFAESKGIKIPSIPSEDELMDKISIENLENVSNIKNFEEIGDTLGISSLDKMLDNPPKINPPSIDSIIQIPNIEDKLAAIEQFIQSKLNS